ncbi:MAG TPA: imidazole glycerol phosphate synthase subunit HisH [Nitriliruptorales bacterium]
MKRVAVLDYEAGNVRSAKHGLERAGAEAFITSDPGVASESDALVIPGVGHFSTCIVNLRRAGLEQLVRDWIVADRPVYGICVGMQLLYESSEEGDEPGLGLLPGTVRRLPDGFVVPHMGWDVVEPTDSGAADQLLDGVAGERCYFVHSYYADPADVGHVLASCSYADQTFPCLVREGSVTGSQFHPEKSSTVGLRLLANWLSSLR